MFQLSNTRNYGVRYLKSLEISFQGSFDKDLFNKVAKFQSIQFHLVNEVFVGLFDRSITKEEKEINVKYFLMTALYDDLIDRQIMDTHTLNNLFYHPEKANPRDFNVKVLVQLHLDLINQVPEKKAYWETIEQIHQAQKDSAEQFDPQISLERILDITKRKGGYSLLMCRHYLNDPIRKELDDCWYTFGGLIQMTNDLFDTYKDTQDGISTFANTVSNFEIMKGSYQNQKKAFLTHIQNLPVSQLKKIQFCIRTSLIASFGDIAIHQLQKLNNNLGQLPDLRQVARKQLIIDMEKPFNIGRLFLYAYQNGKLWK
jgi:hypothetical protein